ncbi:MAG: response regulator, partial [Candidatus Neomarinimicrobiota bacterium]
MAEVSVHQFTALVVEDNEAHMEYLTYLLKRRRVNVIKAASGEDALEKLDGQKIDYALLDINLGKGMSGFQLIRELRQKIKYEDIPIFSVTAYFSHYDKRALLEEGFTDLIQKPFDYDLLDSKLNN